MATKLLLLNDVDTLGRSGDIVTVRSGYARNFLLPQGFALVADKRAIRLQTRLQEERAKKASEDRQESERISVQLTDVSVEAFVKVDAEGHMYGSVTAADIVHLLQQQAAIEVEKRAIQLKAPIKETGEHTINVKLKEGVVSSFKLQVLPEESRQLKATPQAE